MTDALSVLKSEITATPRNLYVFHGAERYLLEYYTGELKKKIVASGMEEFNYFELSGETLDIDTLAEAVEAVPAFSDTKLVMVSDLDLYSPGAKRKDKLEELLSDIPDYTTLLFIYDTVEFKTDARVKMHKLLGAKALVVDFELQGDRQLVSWLRRRISSLGKNIGFEEAQKMLFTCGRSMTILVNEVEKVAAYSAADNITMSDIEAVCIPATEAVIYRLADEVAAGRFARAIELERELLVDETPVRVLGMLSKQMRELLYARTALDTRQNADWLSRVAGMTNSYAARKALELACKFTAKWCREAVILCVECELDLKSAPGDRSAMLETLILRLAALPR